jgi:triosephosphate isomerase
MQKAQKLVVGNWKMNGLTASGRALAEGVLAGTAPYGNVDIVLCPPATLLPALRTLLATSPISLGGQDCHAEAHGAFTGDIAAEMLADLGARYVIVGHSERRLYYNETNEKVAAKAAAAFRAGLTPVICVGESQEIRSSGNAEQFVAGELRKSLPNEISAPFVIAYEPLWAIGSGKTCEPGQIEAMHRVLKQTVPHARIIYGGSVKAENALEILAMPDVDGVLPGGASLEVTAFTAIVAAASKSS